MHFRLAVVPEINYLSTLVADAFKHYALYQQTIGQTFTKKADYQRFIQQLHAVHCVGGHFRFAAITHRQYLAVFEIWRFKIIAVCLDPSIGPIFTDVR